MNKAELDALRKAIAEKILADPAKAARILTLKTKEPARPAKSKQTCRKKAG